MVRDHLYKAEQFDDGQFYITQAGRQILHLQVQGEQKAEIQIGSHAESRPSPSASSTDRP